MVRKRGILIGGIFLIFVSLLMFFVWRFLFLKQGITASTNDFQCISYDPRYIFEENITQKDFTIPEEQVRRDLRVISKISHCIRTYYTLHGMEVVPRIAREFGMSVIEGAWIEDNNPKNEAEVNNLITIIHENPNVIMTFVGNETMQFRRVPAQQLIDYIERVRKQVSIPVGTSERLEEWRQFPELLPHVDIVGIHALPYWASVPVERAVGWVFDVYRDAKVFAGGKPVFISETGWPSLGTQYGASVPSIVHQAYFIREFTARAQLEGVPYNLFEFRDQPWKMYDEGRTGTHWGLFDSDQQLKFSLTGPVTNDKNWMYWALGTIAIVLVLGGIFLYFFSDLSFAGLLFGILIIVFLAVIASIILQTAISEYVIKRPFLWFFILPTQFFLLFITMIQTVEVVEIIGKRKLKQIFSSPQHNENPKVSIHIPTRNEDPHLVIRAIQSLLALEYPHKEIVIIDNNTQDEQLWKPVYEFSKQYPGVINFFHLDSCPGFKAGALNFGLSKTAPDAEIIGIIDADYVVSPDWLTKTVGYFADSKIAVVQSPQAHETQHANLFGTFIHHEYAGFFEIGMVQRNERNAIIQHGTMTLIRKRVLEQVGAWSEWSITEDAELGIRILLAGYTMYYVHEILGRGEPARTFVAYKKQRFRWVYGAVRIVMKYWKQLLGVRSLLTSDQIFYFTGGWIVWFAQGLYPLFIVFGMIGSVLIIIDQRFFPPSPFLFPSIFYFLFLLISIFLVYKKRVTKHARDIITSMISGAALVPTIARAIWVGIFYKKKPFLQTRNMQNGVNSTMQAMGMLLRNVWLHAFVSLWFLGSTTVLLVKYGIFHYDALLWMIVLVILSIPSLCVLFVSFVDFLSHIQKTRKAS